MLTRENQRALDAFRPVTLTPYFTRYAEGSVLAQWGHTKVLCNTSVQEGVPRFLRDQQQGWLTAEYSMLPRATHTRSDRDSSRPRPNGRSLEIQRLIGRCLRSTIDLKKIPDLSLMIDCDVLQADGGTRTTAINGAMVSLIHALQHLQYTKKLNTDPIEHLITAFSFGLKGQHILLDLDYQEDANIDVDCTLVLSDQGNIIEIQASAEGKSLSLAQLNDMHRMALAKQPQLLDWMQKAINTARPA